MNHAFFNRRLPAISAVTFPIGLRRILATQASQKGAL